ncbi:pyrroline-5-carboxylate reductase [Neisseriaceae bacterium PsAf]|nr:pyrroline-5-carboxylate reductase [Neisseriaceae bacterium PsAf]
MKSDRSIYFLGGGNMAEAIIGAIRQSHPNLRIIVAEKFEERRKYLQENYPSIEVKSALTETLDSEDVLFIAVKPQDALKALESLILESPLVISIVAGLPTDTLSKNLNGLKRIIRIMPNTPVSVLEGMYGFYGNEEELHSGDKEWVENLLSHSGQFVWVPKEDDLHHVTAISGSGPAYVFYFMDALFEAAKSLGFNDEDSRLLVEQTVLGGVKLAQASSFSFQELQQKVTSPKGTTYEAIKVFDSCNLKDVILRGVEACANRSKELSNELELKE